MKLDLFQIDAFTEETFCGNSACLVPLNNWIPDEALFKITRESAVAETVFFVDCGNYIHLRWFSPEAEMDLCGHGTLAAAHVLYSIMNYQRDETVFSTTSGELIVSHHHESYTLKFPSLIPHKAILPPFISKAFNIQPKFVLKSKDYILVYETEQELMALTLDRQILNDNYQNINGLSVTAPGNTCDFVSRYFTPKSAMIEDSVTGSAHCFLIPYWS